MSNPTYDRPAAVAAFAGPVLFLVALAYHPFILFLNNDTAVVEHMTADTTRWFVSHLAVAIGAAGLLLAFLGVRGHIRRTVGTEIWTARALAPLVLATVLFVMLPAMEIAMLAAEEAGADMVATQEALNTWFFPILMTGSVLFAVGTFLFVHGLRKAAILPAGATAIVVAGLAVGALSRFVPMTPSLLLGGLGLVIGFGILGASMWKAQTATSRVTTA